MTWPGLSWAVAAAAPGAEAAAGAGAVTTGAAARGCATGAVTMVGAGAGAGPRRMSSRSSPRCQTSRVTSEASRISTICRRASTSRDVVDSACIEPTCTEGGADSRRVALRLVGAMRAWGGEPGERPGGGSARRGHSGEVLAVAGVDLQDVAL